MLNNFSCRPVRGALLFQVICSVIYLIPIPQKMSGVSYANADMISIWGDFAAARLILLTMPAWPYTGGGHEREQRASNYKPPESGQALSYGRIAFYLFRTGIFRREYTLSPLHIHAAIAQPPSPLKVYWPDCIIRKLRQLCLIHVILRH